jgi:multiple sugar transport system substrate-binding protein
MARTGRMWKLLAAAVAMLALAALAAGGCGGDDKGGGGSGDPVKLTFWHGQTQGAAKLIQQQIDQFNRTHPNIQVSKDSGGVNADLMLQKVTTGLQAGNVPDVAYIFGSDLANLSRSDKVQDLSDAVDSGKIDWEHFYPAARESATVDDRIRAVPAFVDNLAVVYNKKIFDAAGEEYPSDDWTWDDFRATAAKLNDEAKGIAGFGWPGTGDEDTTWRIWPMIWQQGGDILSEDGESVAFDSPEGERALSLIGDMASDGSIYIDNTAGSERMQQLFTSGKMAMNIAGPYALPEYIDGGVDYGVAPLPSFDGDHTTIGGPDTWALFDNGDERSKAAIEFISWLTAPERQLAWLEESGSLPTRDDVTNVDGFEDYQASVPGLDRYVDNLEQARVRPTIAQYPQISQAMGKAIAQVLNGKAEPADALAEAADKAGNELSIPGG